MRVLLPLIFSAISILSCSTSKKESESTSESSQPEEVAGIDEGMNGEEKIIKEIDSRRFPEGISKIIEIDESGAEWNASRTVLRTIASDGKTLDELFITRDGDGGGVALIMINSFGNVRFESDTKMRVERGLQFTGPSRNGHHYFNGDSVLNDKGIWKNLKGDTLAYVYNEYHASHIEYYEIKYNGKIERIVWNENWNSLDTLPKIKLMYTRNEVFARHGYKFKMNEFQNYFQKLEGFNYAGKYDDVYKQLTSDETEFVEYVKMLEDQGRDRSGAAFSLFKSIFSPSSYTKEIAIFFSKKFLDGGVYDARKIIAVNNDVFCFIVSQRSTLGSYVAFTANALGNKIDSKIIYNSEGGDLYHRDLKFVDPSHFEFTGVLDLSLYDDTTDGPLSEEQKKSYPKVTKESYTISSLGKIVKENP